MVVHRILMGEKYTEKELVKIVESTTKNNNLLEQLIAVNMATERNTKLTKNSLDNMSGSLV